MNIQRNGKEENLSFVIEETKSDDKGLQSELPLTTEVSFEPVDNIPQQYSTHQGNTYLRRRTIIKGTSSMKEQRSEYHDMEKKMQDRAYKKTFVQKIDWIIMRLCINLIYVVDYIIPKKFNPREVESEDTLCGRKLREVLLDKGKNTRILIALVVFLSLGFGTCYIILSTPWKSYFASDVILEYHMNGDTRSPSGNKYPSTIVNNVLMPRYMNPLVDPSDLIRINHLVKQDNVFNRVTVDDIKRGYMKTFVEYPHGVNVSFELLENIMIQEANNRKLGCLCAAHVGVPLNVVWAYKKGFYHEPKMTLGTSKVGIMGPIKNANLYYNASIASETSTLKAQERANHALPPNNNGFYITHPYGIALRYVTKEGLKSDEVYGKVAGCVVFCCELAAKKPLVGPYDQGGVLLTSDGNTKKFGIL